MLCVPKRHVTFLSRQHPGLERNLTNDDDNNNDNNNDNDHDDNNDDDHNSIGTTSFDKLCLPWLDVEAETTEFHVLVTFISLIL